jgi:hypothetical protein
VSFIAKGLWLLAFWVISLYLIGGRVMLFNKLTKGCTDALMDGTVVDVALMDGA